MITPVLSKHDSIAISYLRVAAMGCIVLCHFLQAWGNYWAWVFNIGVQFFLLISGFLYGHKNIDKWMEWYYGRFKRVYIPYIVFLIAVFPLLAVCRLISMKQVLLYILNLQGLKSLWNIESIGHLWFLTAIALCYAITPLLQFTSKYARMMFWTETFLVIIWLTLCHTPVDKYLSWIVLYSIGYYLASTREWERFVIGFIAAFGFCFLISTDFSWDYLRTPSGAWSIAFHVSGAIAAFITVTWLFNAIRTGNVALPIRMLDKYSFYIYSSSIHYFRTF